MSQENLKTKKQTEISEPKIDSFFDKLPDDYIIKLYIYNGLKKEFLRDYVNEYPSNEDIRNEFGPGRFALFCKSVDDTGKSKLVDSTEFTLADLKKLKQSNIPNDVKNSNESEEEFLKRLAIYKEIFSNQNQSSNNDINGMIQLMSLNMQAQQQSVQLQQEQMKAMVDMQIQQTRQIQDMILSSTKSEKKGFTEFIEFIDFYESIKGEEKTSDSGGLTKMFLNNPEAIGSFINQFIDNSPKQQPAQANNTDSSNGKDSILNQFPDVFIKSVTRDKKDQISKQLFEANKEKITLQAASDMIESILTEKGL